MTRTKHTVSLSFHVEIVEVMDLLRIPCECACTATVSSNNYTIMFKYFFPLDFCHRGPFFVVKLDDGVTKIFTHVSVILHWSQRLFFGIKTTVITSPF